MRTLVLSLFLSTCAFGAGLPLGPYTVAITSILPELDGTAWTASLAMDGSWYHLDLVPRITRGHDFEEWSWNEKTLVTKEHHFGKTGCHEVIYSATNDGGKYRINCQNGERDDCDEGIDGRTCFTFTPSAEGFRFEVWGVSTPENRGEAATLRHTYTFTRVK